MKNCKLLFKLRPGEGISFERTPLVQPLYITRDKQGTAYVMEVLNVFGVLKHPIFSIFNDGKSVIYNCGEFTSRILNAPIIQLLPPGKSD